MNTNLFNSALIFAINAHSGAVRKGTNIPYFVHPLETAAIVASMTDDKEIIAAAALHDVVEDTKYTSEDIKTQFGERIAKLVSAESENKRPDLPEADT